MKPEIKKLLILNLPYLLFVYLFDKVGAVIVRLVVYFKGKNAKKGGFYLAYVPVSKDLSKVKTKVALNLTKRQIICFAAALILGASAFLSAQGQRRHKPCVNGTGDR